MISRTDAKKMRRPLAFLGVMAFFALMVVVFSGILLPFLVALFMAFVMEPVVSRLAGRHVFRRPLARWVAVLLVYLGFFVLLGLVGGLAGPRLGEETRKLIADVPNFIQRVKRDWIPEVNSYLRSIVRNFAPETSDDTAPPIDERETADKWRPELRRVAERAYRVALSQPLPAGDPSLAGGESHAVAVARKLPDGSYRFELSGAAIELQETGKQQYQVILRERAQAPPLHQRAPAIDVEKAVEQRLQSFVDGFGARLTDYIGVGRSVVSSVVGALGLIALTFVIAAFLSIDLQAFHRFFRGLVPRGWHPEYDALIEELDRGLSGVIRGQLLICVINGVLTAIGLYTLGVPYAGIWSLLAGVMSLIPVFGTILSSAPMIGVSVFTTEPMGLLGLSGIALGFATLGWIMVIHFIETSVLEPKIIGRHAKIHPVLILFALLAGEHFFGVPGLIFAVPVLSVVQTLFLFLKEKLFEDPGAAPGTGSDRTE